MLIDSKTGKPTRVKARIDADGTKERVGVKSGEVIPAHAEPEEIDHGNEGNKAAARRRQEGAAAKGGKGGAARAPRAASRRGAQQELEGCGGQPRQAEDFTKRAHAGAGLARSRRVSRRYYDADGACRAGEAVRLRRTCTRSRRSRRSC